MSKEEKQKKLAEIATAVQSNDEWTREVFVIQAEAFAELLLRLVALEERVGAQDEEIGNLRRAVFGAHIDDDEDLIVVIDDLGSDEASRALNPAGGRHAEPKAGEYI